MAEGVLIFIRDDLTQTKGDGDLGKVCEEGLSSQVSGCHFAPHAGLKFTFMLTQLTQ